MPGSPARSAPYSINLGARIPRALEVASVDKDIFVAESVGAEIHFERDASGKVIALTLKQRGQALRGERH